METKKFFKFTLHRTLFEPTTPTQPCESSSGVVQESELTIGSSIFRGVHVDVESLSAVRP